MKSFIAGDDELALIRASAFRADSVNIVAGVNRQPVCFWIFLSINKGSPPGYSTFFILSATRGDVAPNVAAEHNLQFSISRSAAASLHQKSGHSGYTNQGRQQYSPCLVHLHGLS